MEKVQKFNKHRVFNKYRPWKKFINVGPSFIPDYREDHFCIASQKLGTLLKVKYVHTLKCDLFTYNQNSE